ncbi:type IV pilus assembly protein PilC [Micrococcales bacterium KH10]|nr:type IV pilus assembly protein PilC [Micrococcales bacterium KH10]
MAPSAKTKTYEYEARDKQGNVVKGRMDGPNEAAVASRLMANGGNPLKINEVKTGGLHSDIKIPGLTDKIPLKDIAVMSRQLATMINAGLSLLRSVTILADQTENKALQGILLEVRAEIETGASFSSALAKHPKVFPPLMINMVKAGETGGFLDQTLLSVAKNFEDDVKLRGKIKSAMTYPIVVLVIAIIAATAMLLFIVPIFAEMFATLGGALPGPTQMLVSLSNFLKVGIIPIIIVIAGLWIWWSRIKHKKSVREKVDPWKLKAPVFGKLTQKIAVARFTRNLGSMLHAGVPILQALEIVGETSGNMVVEKASLDIMDSVRRGKSLTGPLSEHAVFPPMVVQMMAVGEDTGALDDMLEKIAEFYDAEVEATTEQLTSLIEPLMILFVGVIVGGMVIAMYLPIFNIFNLIQ